MRDEAPKSGGFEFRSGFVVHRHDPLSLFCGMPRQHSADTSKQRLPFLDGGCHRFFHIATQTAR
jgi:hypothetical protein